MRLRTRYPSSLRDSARSRFTLRTLIDARKVHTTRLFTVKERPWFGLARERTVQVSWVPALEMLFCNGERVPQRWGLGSFVMDVVRGRA